jgi:hypothetical protein
MKIIQRIDEDFYTLDYQYVFAYGEDLHEMKSKSMWHGTKVKNFNSEMGYIKTILNIEVSDGEESQESIS